MSCLNPSFTEVQVQEFYKIITKLSEQTIFDLVDSVTKKTITASSAEEAFKAIISFSESPEQLLHRQRISRTLLIEYAFNVNIIISASATKKEIVRKILEHWNKQQNSCKLILPSQQNTSIKIEDLPAFGQTFATWFYKMLNAHNEQTKSSDALDFGPQHFWPDSVLQANTMTDTTVMGAERIAERLLQFTQEGFYFHANIPDGVHTKSESHGLICVLVHGTVHKQQICLGPFEQAFTLLQDPLHGNNWKIKNIWLSVNGSSKARTLAV